MDNNIQRYNETAELLKVLAHPVRLCIVNGLLQKGRCNVSYMQNCLGVPQSTISQHLQKLRSAGIIEGERNGLEINYSVCSKTAEALVKLLFNDSTEE
ncbi:metalloregulator ArsR/SmtB family transcription factor [Clostridium sp. CX1]|uniref:Metalloregulator ArsR/SmtB family transcription factor n=1 Tax=Clostridium tanneri TaxID=3037988 RepID=A0ABU4JRC2_9CLOT|nr:MULTISPECIES: metalloregulator ArsR/SmtB family transcription factor [unclassified Clostridium]MCT8975836.1 metalloregulator ArsR/SmtB family transcription factor [Clostridium sp. CX1]MDW8800689.1 metalloregulator ArsR/SmtB family transcription factor [Clostridium sp. A1-XYC3]